MLLQKVFRIKNQKTLFSQITMSRQPLPTDTYASGTSRKWAEPCKNKTTKTTKEPWTKSTFTPPNRSNWYRVRKTVPCAISMCASRMLYLFFTGQFQVCLWWQRVYHYKLTLQQYWKCQRRSIQSAQFLHVFCRIRKWQCTNLGCQETWQASATVHRAQWTCVCLRLAPGIHVVSYCEPRQNH